ncbi:MAG TPA: glycoside hydrolase family 15 protein [Syntrophorhabdaceae bacterium]|jgi:GH15 family glucan-1,4-alpha-glucosidase
MYKKISDYGIIGNLRAVALIGPEGSIDWLCLPYLDSPSVFAALLDHEKGGRFALTPVGAWDSASEYLPETNILKTRFRTTTGEMELVDFMPIQSNSGNGEEAGDHELCRRLTVTAGTVEVGMVFEPRFDYARSATTVERNGRMLVARGGGETMTLAVSEDIPGGDDSHTARWALEAGHVLWFRLKYNTEGAFICHDETMGEVLRATEEFWRGWLRSRETGQAVRLGHYQAMVDRSALVLKLLQFEETGTIAAAATTSLPEEVGGIRNWDYRYTWVRDTTFTLEALFSLGHLSETEGYLRWVEKLLIGRGAEGMQTMYGLRGEEKLVEYELPHLEGYKASRPVRVGNAAAKQKQLDIYGEIMDAALKLSGYVGKIDFRMWPVLGEICDYVVCHWHEPDSGIWEVRAEPRHFVYSKVLCWVALDRGITIARRYGFPADLKTWEKTRTAIKEDVLAKGWSREKNSFVQHYDTVALDASSLLIPVFGFLSFDDHRVISTVEAIERELGHDEFLYRYLTEDGLPGREGTFMLCSFWLVDCLIGLGRLDDAEFLLRRLEYTANHLGLFSEMYDVRWQEALGNFPQAFTHIGYINSVMRLIEARGEAGKGEQEPERLSFIERMGFSGIILNDGPPGGTLPSREIASRLKNTMNILRGAFFDTALSRVAYERMKTSEVYKEYLELSYGLKEMDLHDLKTRNEKLAFWINLYNVIVIHAVVELGIRDSVREVRNFFGRVCFRIDGELFTPYDIEHGILRANRRPPFALSQVFGKDDPRRAHTIEPLEPRVHFVLVCASSSCPPIDVYTAEDLEEELDISGRTFLNAGGIVIDRERNRVVLSRIFRWYAHDFGRSPAERLRFIAGYLYDKDDRKFIEKNAEALRIDYQKYDWRLNRY